MLKRKKFGDFLLEKEVIQREELTAAVKAQQVSGKKLGETLMEQGILDECRFTSLLAEYFQMDVFPASDIEITEELLALIPKQLAYKYNIAPVSLKEGNLFVACTDQVSGMVVENLRRVSGKRVHLVMMKPSDLSSVLQAIYDEPPHDGDFTVEDAQLLSPDYAVNLLDGLLAKAINMRASDVHLEPDRDHLRVRLRIDGMLKTVEKLPPASAPSIISRLKVLGNMNIAEKRSPQDGGFLFNNNGYATNIRVSSLPCSRGEKVVLRLLPSREDIFTIKDLGMEPNTSEAFLKTLHSPHGLILVTGPSGSGKTFTLYAALRHLRSDCVNITTVEDPSEIQMEGITQTQIDHTAAKKYAYCVALKAILRQDPDIIMVGEIRDGETARLTLQAALSGHLVLSSLHTNDAPSAVERLVDMGCERYLVASALRGVLAQRLIRIVCSDCRQKYTPSQEELAALGLDEGEEHDIFQSSGCVLCHGTGYRGRTGVFELLSMNRQLRRMISDGANAAAIREYARGTLAMRTLREDALQKMLRGISTPAEVLKVTREL